MDAGFCLATTVSNRIEEGMFGLIERVRNKLPKPPGVVKTTIDVDGRPMPLVIRSNPRSTRITLRIEPGGNLLKMTVPPGVPRRDVDDFLRRHQEWLADRLSRFGDDRTLRDGSEIHLRGVSHQIEHTGKLRGLTQSIEREGRRILTVSGMEEHTGRRVADFLKKEARGDIESYVAIHSKAAGRPYKSITMKDTRSRWGSCSSDGKLSFSWRIVMAPPFVIDYLAAHEVAHLREMNHEAKVWLKKNGTLLHAIDFGPSAV
jgi:predicted metal-dependent hydrolase